MFTIVVFMLIEVSVIYMYYVRANFAEEPLTGEHIHKAILQNDTGKLESVLDSS